MPAQIPDSFVVEVGQENPLSTNRIISDFNLEHFEWQAQAGEVEPACRSLVFLLGQLDKCYGQWGEAFQVYAPGVLPDDINQHICTRLSGAISTLFSRPGFSVSDDGYVQLMNLHRWLALIFAVSGYSNGDHIIRTINAAGGGVVDPLKLNASNLRLFCLCYYPDSQIALQPDVLWQYDKQTVSRLFFALLSPRALPTPAAHGKREQLLAWLPDHLADIDSLDFLPTAVLHDVVMHCSYADLPEKHRIKRHINCLIVKKLQSAPYSALLPFKPVSKRKKPVIAIVLEWFTCQHSIYRTHSSTMRALRDRFHVVGLGQVGATDELTRDVFDEFLEVPVETAIGDIVIHLSSIRPDIVYYPSVGMFPLTIYLINLRLAPVQLMALGHPATTHSECIDGVLVEEDYLGEESCFSERVYPLSKTALPYLPPENTQRIVVHRLPFALRQQQTLPFALPVRVAVCASVMKINPGFLNTLATIEQRSRVPMQFCFYIGFGQGLTLDYLRQAIHAVLPRAEVNAHMPVQTYQQALNSCELFVNPFPFGNTNGLVDTVRQGLPGVCLSGAEVHTHIDEGLFRRLGLPEDMIARDIQTYIEATLRLIEDAPYRESWQKRLSEGDVERVLFEGEPQRFVQTVWDIFKSHSQKQVQRPDGVTFMGRAKMTSSDDKVSDIRETSVQQQQGEGSGDVT